MSNNMRIWDAVQKTDPDYTKKVNQRGGFTAIDAHYQIMSATSQFGPLGDGWGYDTGAPIFEGGAIIIPVTLWHGDRSNKFGPIYGCAEMTGKRLDTDAPKKATTDAITKGLSQLGFNADVFLGRFDDNKYVAELKAEKDASNPYWEEREAKEAALAESEKAEDLAGAEAFAASFEAKIKPLADTPEAGALIQKCKNSIKQLRDEYPDLFKRIESAAKAAGAPMREAA